MTTPARLRFAIRQWQLDQKAVLDLGCGPGEYLQHFGPESVGLDLNPDSALARGLVARRWNFTELVPDDLGLFDAIWCSNIIEHVLSPHAVLIEARRALRPEGRIYVVVPNTNRFRRSAWAGFLAADHVGFFKPITLRHTMLRAGYEVEFLGSPSFPWLPRSVANMLGPVAPVVLAVGRIVPNFQYAAKAHKTLVNGMIVWKE